jgi:hypothetical protein
MYNGGANPKIIQIAFTIIKNNYFVSTNDLSQVKNIEFFHRWQTSSEFELLRADACELLVVFLSHDDCMKEIYNVKNGKFLDTFTGLLI